MGFARNIKPTVDFQNYTHVSIPYIAIAKYNYRYTCIPFHLYFELSLYVDRIAKSILRRLLTMQASDSRNLLSFSLRYFP